MKLETTGEYQPYPPQHSKSRASLNVVRWQPELFKKKKKIQKYWKKKSKIKIKGKYKGTYG